MLTNAIPIKEEATVPSTDLEPSKSILDSSIPKEAPIVDDEDIREERSIPSRPIFTYREELAHINHPVYLQNAYPDSNPFNPYPV